MTVIGVSGTAPRRAVKAIAAGKARLLVLTFGAVFGMLVVMMAAKFLGV